MDFAVRYSDEQQGFRTEVCAWLDANIDRTMEESIPPDVERLNDEQFRWGRAFRERLGAKGWLAPTWPEEYGGGGLSPAHQVVLDEELTKRHIPNIHDLGLSLGAPAINHWGTDEQKRRFLPGILTGKLITWQVFTEPEAGSDLASLKTRAVEDGDDYVLNGNKIFVGARHQADYLYTLAVTDPTAPRHQNISAFMVPAGAPGLTMTHLDLIAGGGKRMIYFEDVRVPRENLIGGEAGRGKGWWVAQTTLELEHGGSGRVVREPLVDKFIAYCKETKRHGKAISSDARNRQVLAEIYIRSHVGRLLGTRNYWMRTTGKKFSYEGSQFSLWGKTFQPWLAKQVREVAGPYASLDDPELGAIAAEMENQQRQSIATHPGGTPEIQRVIMARGIGVSRTPQRNAETGAATTPEGAAGIRGAREAPGS